MTQQFLKTYLYTWYPGHFKNIRKKGRKEGRVGRGKKNK